MAKQNKRIAAHKNYSRILWKAKKEDGKRGELVASSELGRRDLFFLLYYILGREDIDRDWLFERCREVQANPNGYMDLWAREHYKSTIITEALTLQDIINDPEIRIGIFSITSTEAEKFLDVIKQWSEMENLLDLYPEVFWRRPKAQAPHWSLSNGLVFRRNGVYQESTVECWALEAMPTGRHFQIRVYDDVINEKHVTSPEMIKKAMDGWRLSSNLGSQASIAHYKETNIRRIIGTRYHQNDPYGQIEKEGIAQVRKHPCTLEGTTEGTPVLYSREVIADKRRDQGPYIFGCQWLLDPVADQVQGFDKDWFRYYKRHTWDALNLYLLCDPASEKKKTSDYTVMLVIGLGPDKNYYVIDGIRDRMNLTQRAQNYISFHREYSPTACGYEKNGYKADIEFIQYLQEEENYRFEVVEINHTTPKPDRIRKLVPLCEQSRWFLPTQFYYIDYQRKQHNLTQEFIDEALFFPIGDHDDILDCAAQITDEDIGAQWPMTPRKRYHAGITNKAKTEYDFLGDGSYKDRERNPDVFYTPDGPGI